MAHARRKVVEALDIQPKEAEWLVLEMRKLYLIERHAREEAMTAEQRHALRHKLAAPILGGIKVRLDQLRPTLLPQSPLGKAVSYALAGNFVFAIGAAGLALLASLLRRQVIPRMDSRRAEIQAGGVDAIPGFRRVHVTAILLNLAQLALIVWSLTTFSVK